MRASAPTTIRISPFASPGFARLWAVGGISSAMLWLEVLAASLFTLEVTHSGWLVAVVSAARAAPLLLFGALAGVVSDAWDRRRIVLGGLLVSATSAGAIGGLAVLGRAEPWHVAIAALVSGSVYATEMPARRRMVAECAGGTGIDAAVAADSLTSYAARCIGPLLGGLTYGRFGLAGAFLISSGCSLAAAFLLVGLPHRQATRPLLLGRIGPDLRDALQFARRAPSLGILLAVTVTMNLCGYSYATLLAPVAKASFHLDDGMTGVLAAAEPAGAFVGGMLMTRLALPGRRLTWLMGGVAILTGGLIGAAGLGALGAALPMVCLALATGGLGSAVYNNNQTSIVMAETPPALRSRMMGLVTVCIGSWPLGMLLAGGLSRSLPPLDALAVLASCGLGLVTGIAVLRQILVRRRALQAG